MDKDGFIDAIAPEGEDYVSKNNSCEFLVC